jgi:hypothetical protein
MNLFQRQAGRFKQWFWPHKFLSVGLALNCVILLFTEALVTCSYLNKYVLDDDKVEIIEKNTNSAIHLLVFCINVLLVWLTYTTLLNFRSSCWTYRHNVGCVVSVVMSGYLLWHILFCRQDQQQPITHFQMLGLVPLNWLAVAVLTYTTKQYYSHLS